MEGKCKCELLTSNPSRSIIGVGDIRAVWRALVVGCKCVRTVQHGTIVYRRTSTDCIARWRRPAIVGHWVIGSGFAVAARFQITGKSRKNDYRRTRTLGFCLLSGQESQVGIASIERISENPSKFSKKVLAVSFGFM